MSATEILAFNDCSFARVDEEQPVRLLPPVPAFPTAGAPPTACVPGGAPSPDARNCTRNFSFLDETAMGHLHAAVTVLIATDMDVPGQRLAHELAMRIGHATRPGVSGLEGGKDANVVLMKLGAPAVGAAPAEVKAYPIPSSPAHGTRPIRVLPPSRDRHPCVELSPLESSHAP